MPPRFRRLAALGRGPAAVRLLDAVAELGPDRPVTIALYVDADRSSRFVREADTAVGVGPFIGDLDRVEAALRESAADAVWFGHGLGPALGGLTELSHRMGLTLVGPSAQAMARIGDPIVAKRLAEELGIATVPWSEGQVDDVGSALGWAAKLGYPLFVKAASARDGQGIRRVSSATDLPDAFEAAGPEAALLFGDPRVYLEQRVGEARHIGVKVIADGHGGAWVAGLCECTLQRRNRTIVEESAAAAPAAALGDQCVEELRAAATRLAAAAGFTGVCTVDFLVGRDDGRPLLLGVDPLPGAEYGVTEVLTGLDLVKVGLELAARGRLDRTVPQPAGHAIAVRLRAEDPERGFAPTPGRIRHLRLPTGPGLRVEAGVGEGDVVPAGMDPALATVVAWGQDREEAVARLVRGLRQTRIVIDGGGTNKAFLLSVLTHPAFQLDRLDTGWLDRGIADRSLFPTEHADVALLQAAVDAYATDHRRALVAFFASAARGRPEARRDQGHRVRFRYRGQDVPLRVLRLGPQAYRVDTGARRLDLTVTPRGPLESLVTVGDQQVRTLSVVEGPVHSVEVEGVTHTFSRDDGGTVRAPAPGVVLSIPVRPGDRVAVGDTVAVLEAMKMETAVAAPFAGRVRSVSAMVNAQVESGQTLLELELGEDLTAPDPRPGPTAQQLDLALPGLAAGDAGPVRPDLVLETLHAYLLGYDTDPKDIQRLITRPGGPLADLPVDDLQMLAREGEILRLFADLCVLSRRQHEGDEVEAGLARSPQEYFATYLRAPGRSRTTLPPAFLDRLRRVLARYGVPRLEPSPELDEALLRIFRAQQRLGEAVPVVASMLERAIAERDLMMRRVGDVDAVRRLLDRLVDATDGRYPTVADLARDARFRWFGEPELERVLNSVYATAEAAFATLRLDPGGPHHEELVAGLVSCPQPMRPLLQRWYRAEGPELQALLVEIAVRRYYRIRALEEITARTVEGRLVCTADYVHEGHRVHLVMAYVPLSGLADLVDGLRSYLADVPADRDIVLDVQSWRSDGAIGAAATAVLVQELLDGADAGRSLHRVDVAVTTDAVGGRGPVTHHVTFRPDDEGHLREELLHRDMHPMIAKRLELWRLQNFRLERLESVEDVYLFHGVAHENPKDERLFALAEVRDLTPTRDTAGHIVGLPLLERILAQALSAMRQFQSHRNPDQRLLQNRVILYVRPPLDLPPGVWRDVAHRLAPQARGLGLEEVLVRVRIPDASTGDLVEQVLHVSDPGSRDVAVRRTDPAPDPVQPLSEYRRRVLQAARRGATYPYEIVRLLTPPGEGDSDLPPGEFVEHDLDDDGELVPVDRPFGENTANLVVGVVRNWTGTYPDGMARVILLGDPSRSLGALAEPECRRIVGALDLAERMRVPLEWFAISSGARISMTSGTENMDWIGAVLRRLIEFTQAGGEVNIVVTGINVGAQPYWNAEATMLMHTKGILVMIPESAMVLTGKQALDYSGGVSAEDNLGIGGYERVMGPNGQGQYWAPDLAAACSLLFRYYDLTYVVPGEHSPRRAPTSDPVDRDIRTAPHPRLEGSDFTSVGDIFTAERNPDRKKPFEIRAVMRATMDVDCEPLERWARWGETAIVWDGRVGGIPVCMIGLESTAVPRSGFVPGDGPSSWTSGTLFPQASRKVARAVNAASGNRPVVVLANLSGFDGSPESMRQWQLEYGAEIGRAVTNFRGPIVFVVVSRYHGGAFVVFSKTLNPALEIAAVEGSFASVIGGAPAAAVVFAHEVDKRARADQRVLELTERVTSSGGDGGLRLELQRVMQQVRSEKLGEVAAEFDGIHSIERALAVGSVDHIIAAADIRPYVVDALDRGMARTAGDGVS